MHLKTRFLAGFGRRLKRILPNHIVLDNTIPTVASADHVMNRPGILDSSFARHPNSMKQGPALSCRCCSLIPLTRPISGKPPPAWPETARDRGHRGRWVRGDGRDSGRGKPRPDTRLSACAPCALPWRNLPQLSIIGLDPFTSTLWCAFHQSRTVSCSSKTIYGACSTRCRTFSFVARYTNVPSGSKVNLPGGKPTMLSNAGPGWPSTTT